MSIWAALRLSKKKVAVITVIVVLCIIAVWYFYSVTASYEIELLEGEEHGLWIGIRKYSFELEDSGLSGPPVRSLILEVTCGNDTKALIIGSASGSVGKTYKLLDLELYIKEELVDGLRVVVKKQ